MTQGKFSKEEAKSCTEALHEVMKAFPKSKVGEFIGHFNDLFLFLSACEKTAPSEAVETPASHIHDARNGSNNHQASPKRCADVGVPLPSERNSEDKNICANCGHVSSSHGYTGYSDGSNDIGKGECRTCKVDGEESFCKKFQSISNKK